MVEVHTDRDVRVDFADGVHHVLQHDVVGIGAGAARRLDDDGSGRLVGSGHDGQRLFHVVDVERRNPVVMLSSVIKQLAKGNSSHSILP